MAVKKKADPERKVCDFHAARGQHDLCLNGPGSRGSVAAELDSEAVMLRALQRIANHEYRPNRRGRRLVDASELEMLIRTARIALERTGNA